MVPKTHHYEISTKTLLEALGIAAGLYLAYRLRSIILVLFVAALFAASMNPLVTRLERHHIPRGLSIAFVYIAVIGLLAISAAAIIPPLFNQASLLFAQFELPPIFTQRLSDYNLQELDLLVKQLTTVPKVLESVFSTLSSVVFFLTFGIIAYYLLMERPMLHRYLTRFFGSTRDEKDIEVFVNNVESQIGGWIRGQVILMAVIGILTFTGLTLLNVSYALPLAILAGFLEIIPTIGPTLSAVPAILIATFTVSLPMGMVVAAMYVLIQQAENNFIVPAVMKKSIGIHPLTTIILLLVGLELWGILGAILVIPVYLTIRVAWQEWVHFKNPGTVITGTFSGFMKPGDE